MKNLNSLSAFASFNLKLSSDQRLKMPVNKTLYKGLAEARIITNKTILQSHTMLSKKLCASLFFMAAQATAATTLDDRKVGYRYWENSKLVEKAAWDVIKIFYDDPALDGLEFNFG